MTNNNIKEAERTCEERNKNLTSVTNFIKYCQDKFQWSAKDATDYVNRLLRI